MNSTIEDQYKVQPELKEALNRLSEKSREAVTNIQNVSEAITPLKTFMQISENSQEFFKDINWNNVYSNAFQPSAYTEAVDAFNEIQEAAIQRFAEGQKEIFEAFTNDTQNLLDSGTMNTDNPQQAMATYIDKSLETYENIKEKVEGQSQNVSAVSSAYIAWMQQTIESLSKSPRT